MPSPRSARLTAITSMSGSVVSTNQAGSRRPAARSTRASSFRPAAITAAVSGRSSHCNAMSATCVPLSWPFAGASTGTKPKATSFVAVRATTISTQPVTLAWSAVGTATASASPAMWVRALLSGMAPAKECSGQKVGRYHRSSGRMTTPPGWCIKRFVIGEDWCVARVMVRRSGAVTEERTRTEVSFAPNSATISVGRPSSAPRMLRRTPSASVVAVICAGWLVVRSPIAQRPPWNSFPIRQSPPLSA